MERFGRTCAACSVPISFGKDGHGSRLVVVGIDVDLGNLCLRLSQERTDELRAEIRLWMRADKKRMGEFRTLAGWLSWYLNVFPLGRPFLTALYKRCGDPKLDRRKLHVGLEVKRALSFFDRALQQDLGLYFILADIWRPGQENYRFYVDASTSWGLGIWIPGLQLGLACKTVGRPEFASLDIFPLEMLAIYCAVLFVRDHLAHQQRVLIWSDSSNSVDAFNTLTTSSATAQDVLEATVLEELRLGISLRILHVPGTHNPADSLSRGDVTKFRSQFPKAIYRTFEPPTWPFSSQNISNNFTIIDGVAI